MILIPGAMHGAWTWDRVTPLLEAAGYRVIAPDLPGMGPQPGIASADVTLAGWADFVADLVRGVDGPVILAGHSRGGLVIGEAAERVPERVAGLIYVTAMIVLPGQTGMQAGRDPAAQPPPDGAASPPAFSPERAKAIFYNCCTPEDADWAVARLEAEPPAPLHTPAGVTWARWGQVPRGYVECRQDQTLSLARQRRFQAAAPCNPVIALDTDHSPFLSTPRELAAAMVQMAGEFLTRQ
jgi:pimeloyl-ACP methyl ester carboxylesterase